MIDVVNDQDIREIAVKNSQSVFFKATCLFGNDNQKDMIIEECAELITAIQHYRRGKNTRECVVNEIVDVQIMIEQAKIIFDPHNRYYNNIYREKVNRLEKMLEHYK